MNNKLANTFLFFIATATMMAAISIPAYAQDKHNNNKNRYVIHHTTTTTTNTKNNTKVIDVQFETGYTEICSVIGNKELHCILIPKKSKK